MASERRLEKLNNMLREQISKIIDREIEFPENTLVTVTKASVSEDLHYAEIRVSVIGAAEKQVLEILGKNVYDIQYALNRKLRMRPVPRIKFVVDEEELRREVVEKTLADLKQKGGL